MPRIVIISAVSENGVIGKNNDLPWRVPRDFKFFLQRSRGHATIMGRKSYEGMPRDRARRDIVITRNAGWQPPANSRAIRAESFDAALAIARQICGGQDIIIAGGAAVYAAALPLADLMYLTRIHCRVEGGDALFPAFDESAWEKLSETYLPAIAGETADHTVTALRRK